MTTVWVVAFVCLAALMVVTAMLVLGIAHRAIGAIDRLQAVFDDTNGVELAADPRLPVGSSAPDLPEDEQRLNGPGDRHGREQLVVFLEIGCDACRVLAADLRRNKLRPGRVTTIAVVDVFEGEFSKLPAGWRTLLDVDGELFRSWQVVATPVAYFVDSLGPITDRAFPNTVEDLTTVLTQGGDRVVPQKQHHTI